METNCMFINMSSEELYDIDGGSTKIASIVCIVGAAACGVGAYVASKTGHSEAAAWLTGATAVCALAGAWLGLAPSHNSVIYLVSMLPFRVL